MTSANTSRFAQIVALSPQKQENSCDEIEWKYSGTKERVSLDSLVSPLLSRIFRIIL